MDWVWRQNKMVKIQGMNFVLLFALATCPFRAAISSIPKINVRIGKNLKQINVSGINLKKKLHQSKRSRHYIGRKTLNFNCHSKAKVNLPNKPVVIASLGSSMGHLNWANQMYKGELKILTSELHKGCDLVNEIPLEAYISSLVIKEMSVSWPKEALKAQAVAARTYAYHKMETSQVSKVKGFKTHYDLENSEKHQVNAPYQEVNGKARTVSKETSGEILVSRGGKVTPTFFHSKCGGKTLRASQVWGRDVDGHRSVPCPFCHPHGKKNWKVSFSQREFKHIISKTLSQYYKKKLKKNSKLRVIKDNTKNSRLRLYSNDSLVIVQKSKIRSTLGTSTLPSNSFTVELQNKKIILNGQGHGHGVGMCQFGAYELAKRGYNYKQILGHYFPEHKIKKIY